MGVIALLKPKPYVAPVNKTPTFYNHKQNDARLIILSVDFRIEHLMLLLRKPTFPNRTDAHI